MSAHEPGKGAVRIGELSRRVGVTPEVLRAWERRYGILSPTRTEGGFRLYGEDDERRVRRMLENLEKGLSAAEAAGLARAESASRPDPAAGTDDGSGPPTAAALGEQLRRALDGFDDVGAHSVVDRLLGSYPLEIVLRDAVLPYLHQLGERWAHAEASIAQEHFASALLRGRLLALARDWGRGRGPHALLACVPGDQHDLGLICFALALRAHGWRITYLGADTPLPTLIDTAELLQPALVVVSAALPELAQSALGGLRELACVAPLALAGRGTDASIADTTGALWLNEDPFTAAASTTDPGLTQTASITDSCAGGRQSCQHTT
jgi:MerR family transcriptional regulator, light-induced transcriptional regulator